MSTKHTPGPWEVLDGAILCEHVNAYGNFFVASFHRGDEPNTDEDHANARLIAAAPDLLEACGKAKSLLDGSIQEGDQDVVVDALRDALAKAEGRE